MWIFDLVGSLVERSEHIDTISKGYEYGIFSEFQFQ
jgi:hypothetical protein